MKIMRNPDLHSAAGLKSLQRVNGTLDIAQNQALVKVTELLSALQHVRLYVAIDFLNGTVHCPEGTGIGADRRSMMEPLEEFEVELVKEGALDLSTSHLTSFVPLAGSTDHSSLLKVNLSVGGDHGNWCMIHCRESQGFRVHSEHFSHPFLEPDSLWQTRPGSVWSRDWAPSCISIK